MKNVILFKQHLNPLLGHIYEHLIVREINAFLFNQGVYKYLDYNLSGTSYDKEGLIYLEFEPFTKKAEQFISEIAHVSLGLHDEEKIIIALFQVNAEEKGRIAVSDMESLKNELTLLDAQPWQNISSIGWINTKSIRRKQAGVKLHGAGSESPKQIKQTVVLNSDFAKLRPELLPLFTFLARTILFSINTELSATVGVYISQPFKVVRRPASALISILDISSPRVSSITISRLVQTAKGTTSLLLTPETIDRLSSVLGEIDYSQHPTLAPPVGQIIEETGILMGPTGWQSIASKKNINVLLKNMSYTVQSGSASQSFMIK